MNFNGIDLDIDFMLDNEEGRIYFKVLLFRLDDYGRESIYGASECYFLFRDLLLIDRFFFLSFWDDVFSLGLFAFYLFLLFFNDVYAI